MLALDRPWKKVWVRQNFSHFYVMLAYGWNTEKWSQPMRKLLVSKYFLFHGQSKRPTLSFSKPYQVVTLKIYFKFLTAKEKKILEQLSRPRFFPSFPGLESFSNIFFPLAAEKIARKWSRMITENVVSLGNVSLSLGGPYSIMLKKGTMKV